MRTKAGVVALALALVISFPTGAEAQGTSEPLLGQNHRLLSNTPGRQLDVPGLAVDPADPDHIVEADVNPPNFQCDHHVSFDGGATWSGDHLTVAQVPGLSPPFPSPACAQNFDSGGYAHFNTGIVFGSGQNVYVTFSVHRGPFQRLDTAPPTEGGKGDDVVVARSSDGGRTFLPAVLAIPGSENPQPVSTRPQIAVDRGAGQGGKDRLYVNAWQLHVLPNTTGLRRMLVARSDDGGVTWQAPKVASRRMVRNAAEAAAVGTEDEIVRELSQPVVGPDPDGTGPAGGPVYAAYKNVDRVTGTTCAPNPQPTNCIVVANSSDQGITWSQVSTGVTVSSGGQPRLALDPTVTQQAPRGTLYVVYHSSNDVFLVRSTDGGENWSTPVRVDDGPANTTQSFPQVSVGPGGRVNVIWFDSRHSYPGGGPRLGNIYYAVSTDGGVTFGTDRRVTDRTFNRDVGIESPLGSYSFYGPVAQPLPDGSLFAAWMDSRDGNFDNAFQDIYLSRHNPAAPVSSSTTATATTPGLSVMLSRLSYPGGPEAAGPETPITRVVIANQDDVAGALAGAVLARANWGPLLLSPPGGMPAVVMADAARMKPEGGFVIGETSALSPSVEEKLRTTTRNGQNVSRVAPAPSVPPADRAAEIGRQVGELMKPLPGASPAPTMGAEAVIVNPETPEAGAGAALAAALKLPILFVDSRPTLPSPTAQAISSLDIQRALIVGGPSAVNPGVEAALVATQPTMTVKRLGGADQYATSEAVVKEAKDRGLPTNVLYVADGARPIDAALLGSAVGRLTGLMLLTPSGSTSAAQARLAPLGISGATERLMAAVGTGGTDPTAAGTGGGGAAAAGPIPGRPKQLAGCPRIRAARNLIALTAGNDRGDGTRLSDLIIAGAGNDVVNGRGGADCIDLGSGRDRGQAGAGNDFVEGGPGDDVARGSTGSDRLRGGSGNDRLAGNSGNDSIVGGRGRDRISGGGGRDRISASSGNDRVAAADRRRDRIYCGAGRDAVTADRIDRVARSCERVRRAR